MSAVDDLLEAAIKLAPTHKTQQAFRQVVSDSRDESESEISIALHLSHCISDGLNYGNWIG